MQMVRWIFGGAAALLTGFASAEFVVNGDFSAGRGGFRTTYTYVAPATDALLPESNYTIARSTRDPFVLNTKGITDYKDHTTGDGPFLLVNGAKNRNSLVWEQAIRGLKLGGMYRFTLWVSRWTPNLSTSAKLTVLVDGQEYASFEDPSVSGAWVQHTIRFQCTNDAPVLQIRNLESALYGNDFALDDLSIEEDAASRVPPPELEFSRSHKAFDATTILRSLLAADLLRKPFESHPFRFR